MEDRRTIRVTGSGTLKLRPDITRLTITLNGHEKEYADTVERSSRATDALAAAIKPLGFERTSLKTLSFDVNARYEGVNDKGGNYRRVFMGYEFSHVLKLEFPSDNALLGRVLYALAHSGADPEFDISYTVKDREAAKNELLAKAVEDAAAKAKTLSCAAGTKLGQIRSIDYSWGEIEMAVRPMNRMMKAADTAEEAAFGCAVNIEPDDITVSDTVTVIWDLT